MKKFLTLTLVLLLVCSLSTAYAFTWKDTEAAECTEYLVAITKYAKADADLGTAYEKAPNATAKIGDLVYFDIVATDVAGEAVEAVVEVHHLSDVQPLCKIYSAKVVGPQPWIKASITEQSNIAELTYKGEPIQANGSSVVIGDLVFTRDTKGVVTDVGSNLNTAEMLKELAALGIDIQELYDGKLCMTDDIIIANFGKVCETTDTAAWYVAAEDDPVLGIPKTGDASMVVFPALMCTGVLALCLPRRRR